MSIDFYKSIIDDEIKVFGVKKETLKQAAVSVGKTYSRKSLTNGKTYLDYNVPSYRCAYLYKYASLHTGLATKYFRKLIKKKEAKSSLRKTETWKICCFGGGPGTDIVGLFKALAVIPCYHKKVVDVTILDICGGWRNSFKRIISSLIEGKVKDVPETFVNTENFKFKLIAVNLLDNLPSDVVKVISEADVVCMIKFVSAILGSSTSVTALQTIGGNLKIGAVVLFIDNAQGKTFEPFFDISGQIGLKIIFGPVHESFKRPVGIPSNLKIMFGCAPLLGTRVTVLGFIKCGTAVSNIINTSPNNSSKPLICKDGNTIEDDDADDDSWDTEDESENSVKQTPDVTLGYSVKVYCDKFTQTKESYLRDRPPLSTNANAGNPVNELCSLVDNLCLLVNLISQVKQQLTVKKDCCHYH